MNKMFKEKKDKFSKPKHVGQRKFQVDEESAKEIDKALKSGRYDDIDYTDDEDTNSTKD